MPTQQTVLDRRAANLAEFRDGLFQLASKSVGRNVACDIRELPDDRLQELRQRARWSTRRALQYLLVYGCRVVSKGIDI